MAALADAAGSPISKRPRDNRTRLVTVAVAGRVAAPRVDGPLTGRDGRAIVLPGTGGIHPLVHAGDPADAWIGEHLMVGASVEDAGAGPAEPGALHLLACLGNRVRTASGEPLGVVAGKRGGLAPGFMPPSLVSVEAPRARLEALGPGEGVVLEALGRGLELPDWPDVVLMNLSPLLLDALPLEADGLQLRIAVRAHVPSRAAGAGLGQDAWIGDLEIADETLLEPAGTALAFGDLVAFDSIDARFGRYYRPGIVSLGAVSHGPSGVAGHGIGVTMLIAGPADRLRLVVRDGATVAPALRALAGTEPLQ